MSSLITEFRDFLRRRRFKITKDCVRAAVRDRARKAADVRYQQDMSAFYAMEAAHITPSKDWWGFADCMQKKVDHEYEQQLEEKKLSALTAKMEAAKTRYAALLAAEADSK